MNNYHVEIVYTDQLYEMMYAIALPPLARGAESVILWRWAPKSLGISMIGALKLQTSAPNWSFLIVSYSCCGLHS